MAMNRRSFLSSTIVSAFLASNSKALGSEPALKSETIALSSLHPRLGNQGWGKLFADTNADGKRLQIADRKFEHGLSVPTPSDLIYLVAGRYSKFRAWVGVDAAQATSRDFTARFLVHADGTKLFDSGTMKPQAPAMRLDIDITNVNVLRLTVVSTDDDAEGANWADAELVQNPYHIAAAPRRDKKPLRQIKSDELLFTAGGSSLAGLQLPNGKRIKLEGSFQIGPYVNSDHDAALDVRADFTSAPGGVSWDWECTSRSHRPWTAPIDTSFKWPNPARAKLWMSRGYGAKWQDPLVTQPFEDRIYNYGAFFNREDGLSLPMASILDEENGVGVSFIQSPNDVLLDMQISTTKDGEILFSRAFHRFGGESSKIKFHLDVVVHEPDIRAAMNAIVERYPEYFDPPNPLAHEVGGGGAYSGWEGPLDAKKLAAMGFTVNWKASLDFPYMGAFLPPVKDDEQWNRYAGGGAAESVGPKDEGRYGKTSIREMADYSERMRAYGFHVLNYFNVTEFGTQITYPAPAAQTKDDPPLWTDANRFLHGKFENAVLKSPDPTWTWGYGVVMDCADPAYRDYLLQQVERHIQKIPASSGICIDRMDWVVRYSPNADDGVTWIDGPSRHLRRSWIALMNQMGPLLHDAGKVVFVNDMDRRLELMRQVDGFFDEHGPLGYDLNTSSFLAFRKPLICWTSDEAFRSDPDEYFQRHLYMGAFPMVPYPGDDHSILPSKENEELYLDYGPLFNQLRARTWVLRPDAVSVAKGPARANIFETPRHYVVFVGLGGQQNNERVRLHATAKTARILHPGDSTETTLIAESYQDMRIFEVELKRGCAMLVLEKNEA